MTYVYIIRDNPNWDCTAALPAPSVTVHAAQCVPQMCSPGPDAAEKSHSAAHKGTNGMVSVKHVLKRFPGQGPEQSVSCRTELNPHGSKDICKGSVEVNQTPRLGYKVSSIFLSPARWIPWKKQTSMGFSTDGILPSSRPSVAVRAVVKAGPQNFGRLSFPQNVQFHQIQNVLQNWSDSAKNKVLEEKREIFFHYVFNILN